MTREEAATVLENALVCCGNAPVEATFEAGCDEVCDALQLAISALREHSSWISVEERLPEPFVSVFGSMEDAGDFPAVRECYLVRNLFFFPSLRGFAPVSHWMPMPEPYKKEE